MTPSELKDAITIIAALGGLLLSLYNFFERRRDRHPRLKVNLSAGKATVREFVKGVQTTETIRDVLFVEVINFGERKSYLDMVEVLVGPQQLPISAHNEAKDSAYPQGLESGQNTSYTVAIQEIAILCNQRGISANALTKARVRDSLGHEYFSRQLQIAESILQEAYGSFIRQNILPKD